MRLKATVQLRAKSGGTARHSWLFVLPVGRPFFDGKRERTVDVDQAKELVANTQEAMDFFSAAAPQGGTPYRFPIKDNHTGTERYGDIADVKLAGECDWYGVWVLADWSQETWAAIQASDLEYVSVRTKKYTLEDGRTLNPCIVETSLTNHPRLQSIGTVQDTLSVSLSQSLTQHLEDHDMDELEQLLTTLMETVNQIVENQNRLEQLVTEQMDTDELENSEEADDTENDDTDDVEASQNDEDDTDIEAAFAELTASLTGPLEDIQETVDDLNTSLSQNESAVGDPPTGEKGNEDTPSANTGQTYEQLRDHYMSQGKSREEAQDLALSQLG